MDRKRANPERSVEFTAIGPPFTLPPLEQVTSVAAVCFNAEGEMLVVETSRGPDLPGGHMEVGETSFEQTVQREAMEEGFAELADLRVACLIKSQTLQSEEELSWMVIMTGSVARLYPPEPNGDYIARTFMQPAAFLQVYQGPRDFMSKILTHATTAYPC